MITGFTAGPAYPAVNTMATFAATSSTEPVVKGFPLPAARSMSAARETGKDNSIFTTGAKMDVCTTVRSGGEESIV
jgi:hypothetical protein